MTAAAIGLALIKSMTFIIIGFAVYSAILALVKIEHPTVHFWAYNIHRVACAVIVLHLVAIVLIMYVMVLTPLPR